LEIDMPWSGDSFASKHNHSLDPEAADKAASIANAILKKTGDEASAIRIANYQVGRYKSHMQKKSDE
jgi:uncharacterized protein YdaT